MPAESPRFDPIPTYALVMTAPGLGSPQVEAARAAQAERRNAKNPDFRRVPAGDSPIQAVSSRFARASELDLGRRAVEKTRLAHAHRRARDSLVSYHFEETRLGERFKEGKRSAGDDVLAGSIRGVVVDGVGKSVRRGS